MQQAPTQERRGFTCLRATQGAGVDESSRKPDHLVDVSLLRRERESELGNSERRINIDALDGDMVRRKLHSRPARTMAGDRAAPHITPAVLG